MAWLFEKYLHNSLGMSIVALLMMATMPLLAHRYSAKCRYYLWVVVFIALLFPIRPQINIVIPEALRTLIPLVSTQDNTNLSYDVNIPVSETTPILSTMNAWNWMQYATWLWVTGVITFIAWHIFQHVRFLSSVKRWSEEIGKVNILELLAHTKSQLNVPPIAIKTCACIKTPMLIGLLRPMVLLPKGDFHHEELALILKHELIHYKRKDLWFKVLMMLALAIHWFNPVVYLAVKSTLTLCEISCDEIVLKEMNAKSRAKYGESIIGIMRNGNVRHATFSTNFYSGTMGMKKRIYAMMDMSTKRFSPILFLAVLIVTFWSTTTLALTPAQAKDLADFEARDVEVQPAQTTSFPNTDESTASKPEINVRNLPTKEVELGNNKEYSDENLNYILLPQVFSYDDLEKSTSNMVGLLGYDENGGALITPEIAETLKTLIINMN